MYIHIYILYLFLQFPARTQTLCLTLSLAIFNPLRAQVQLDGIGAAISNLQYFHRSIHKSYVALEVSIMRLLTHFTVW